MLLFVIIVFPMTGCVSKSKHQELVDSFNELKDQKAAAEKSCEEASDRLTVELADLQSRNSELATLYAELNEREAACQEKATDAERMKALVDQLQVDLADQQAVVSQLEDSLRIEVVDKVMFRSGSADVTKEGSTIISKIAPVLKSEADKDIVVVGHADDLPPSENLARIYPSNWELSAARAASIVHMLTWGYKIEPTRIMIQGAGHHHPLTVFDGKNKNYRKTNRVVEIILKPKMPN